jgi:transposase
MSALDKAVAELEARRARDDAERRSRQSAASAFLKEFFDADLAPSRKLKERGVQAVFDGKRIVLQRPDEGVYAEGLMIVVGEQGEIDVSGRSLGAVDTGNRDAKKKELIAEIISHFSL